MGLQIDINCNCRPSFDLYVPAARFAGPFPHGESTALTSAAIGSNGEIDRLQAPSHRLWRYGSLPVESLALPALETDQPSW